MAMKLAVTGKGGVRKTTLSALLARLFARQGYPVLAAAAALRAHIQALMRT